jgi:hypothetical protein
MLYLHPLSQALVGLSEASLIGNCFSRYAILSRMQWLLNSLTWSLHCASIVFGKCFLLSFVHHNRYYHTAQTHVHISCVKSLVLVRI